VTTRRPRLPSTCSEDGCPKRAVKRGRCADHQRDAGRGAGWQGQRDRRAQARFRAAVVELFGGQCAAVINGVRCPETQDLQAHHLVPGNDDPSTGALLCRAHHRALDTYAR
jgi:hypothetical protein